MAQETNQKSDTQKVVDLVKDAGGRIVGRTRLQKIAYILEAAGFGEGLPFEYKHYGPYSEQLAAAARSAGLLGLLNEEEHVASWGGMYSIYRTQEPALEIVQGSVRRELAKFAGAADPVELELAATAAFLAAVEHCEDPWGETSKRKPEKSDGGRVEKARALYQKLLELAPGSKLPQIV